MSVMRHAALHAHGQQIIWQQFVMKTENTLLAFGKSKKGHHKLRCISFKKVINEPSKNYCGFFAAAAGLAAGADLAGGAAADPTRVALLTKSSFGKLLSR